ncbi:MAG: alanine--glyoxylate aminotransferase family protein [Chlamydiae bacterium]|nr:alanine--glyoxylate aminotransferase family protein [Chlamydiota bacterium]MBI3265602.1 alanine--glyoxylate aminotransferase family protein [Chlamydiota bacterium]
MKRVSPFTCFLLNPGPVNTSLQVRKALLRGDLCHREKEFSDLLLKVRKNLLKSFGLEKDYLAVFITGSGTAALEAAMISSLNPQGKVLVLSNGVYGDRMARIAEIYQFPNRVLRVPLGEPFSLEEIEKVLAEDHKIDAVAMVHHETSTGMLNPIEKISRLKSMKGKRLILDAISSLGGEALHFKKSSIHVCVGTANKCLQGLPGVSFVLVRKDAFEEIKNFPPRTLYLDLRTYWKEQEKGGVPFTPSVQTFYALDVALEELLREHVRGRVQRYGLYAQRLRQGFKKMGLEYFIDSSFHSNTLTALKLPQGLTYDFLHDALKEEGFVIYAGQGSLQKKIFRVANMGNLKMKDLERFLKCLTNVLKKRETKK